MSSKLKSLNGTWCACHIIITLLATISSLQLETPIPSTPHNNQPILQIERRSKRTTTLHNRFSSNLITTTREPSGRREVVLVGPKSGGSGSWWTECMLIYVQWVMSSKRWICTTVWYLLVDPQTVLDFCFMGYELKALDMQHNNNTGWHKTGDRQTVLLIFVSWVMSPSPPPLVSCGKD